MSTIISDYLNTENAYHLNLVTLQTTIEKKTVSATLDYCSIVPFQHPQFNVVIPQIVGQAGSIISARSRKPTEFTFTITAITDEQKDQTIDNLMILGLYPAPLKTGTFLIFHPMLESNNLQKIIIKNIEQPTWKIGPMIWKFSCVEGAKPKPFGQLTADIVSEANKQQGTDLPLSQQAAKAGRK